VGVVPDIETRSELAPLAAHEFLTASDGAKAP
jgi:hypothetical protein